MSDPKADWGDIDITRSGLVGVITIRRPPFNYISRDLIRRIGDALHHLDTMDECRAVLLQAEGKHFCAGAMHDPDDETTMRPDMENLDGKYDAVGRLFSSRKPIVAAIQGAVVGAGFGLSMLADFRVAAENAKFVPNFVKIGFCPGFGLPVTLPRVIGPQRAAFMMMTGRRFSAREVEPWGLADLVVPLAELPEAALALAAELAGNAPLGMSATRARLRDGLAEAVRHSQTIDVPEQSRLRVTEDHVEGVLAYRERRPAHFKGR
jgi:enoyl-CoA hydratase/carnithine racemase